jgi:hypothetical protein
MIWNVKPIYQQEAETGGAPGAAAAAQGTPPQGSPAPTPTTGGSILSQGAAAATGAGQAAPANPFDWVPEKHRVVKEGGADLDIEATARKLADANKAFEKRFGSGDVPPKTPEEYAIESLPEGVTFDDIKADPAMQSFMKGAHARGITNAQLEYVLNEHLNIMGSTIGADEQMSIEECGQELRKTWANPTEYDRNLGNAYRALQAFADSPEDAEALDEIGNNPALVRLLAKIGAELQEDTPIGEGTQAAQDWDGEIASLRANPAYLDSSHPEHKQVMAKMDALYSKRYSTNKSKLGGGRSFSLSQ